MREKAADDVVPFGPFVCGNEQKDAPVNNEVNLVTHATE